MTQRSALRHVGVAWHALTVAAVRKRLRTGVVGLTTREAAERLRQLGTNLMPQPHRPGAFPLLFNQLRSPVVSILLLAMALTAALRQFHDLAVIGAVVVLNTMIGFTQERRAARTFASLQQLVTLHARVMRDGRERSLPSSAVVPGDVIMLRAGNRIVADARVVASNECSVVEANLSGESAPAEKSAAVLPVGTALADRKNMVYSGTMVAAGTATAVVCATGPATEWGQIAEMAQQVDEPLTPLQRKLQQLNRQLTLSVCAVALAVMGIGLLMGRPLLPAGRDPGGSILYMAVALAVSAIPEGLPVILTVILALGMRRIASRGALVHRLGATETLGSTSVICTDKTGTITEGQMRISKIITADEHYEFRRLIDDPRDVDRMRLLKIAVLCNDAVVENAEQELEHWRVLGDPTESGLLKSAAQVGLRQSELHRIAPRIAEVPFSAERKFMATLHQEGRHRVAYGKGAPESILTRCKTVEMWGKVHALDAALRRRLQESFERHSASGLRVLGFAYRRLQPGDEFNQQLGGLTLAGFIGLKDPLRPQAKAALTMTALAGIRTVIVTGDHRLTAEAIARDLGLRQRPGGLMDGFELDRLSDAELQKAVPRVDVFARVSPRHKLRIIAAWQRRGEVVAMTGDGVNDAPALQAADIGIALNSGTDVAKEAADLILLEDNFYTIVSVVKQGRVIFDNIRTAVLYLLSDSLIGVTLVSVALLAGWPLPILPAQILWINLIADGLPAIALTAEAGGEGETVAAPPRRRDAPLLDREVRSLIVIITVALTVLLLLLFAGLLQRGAAIGRIRTILFTELALSSLAYIFSIRNLRHSIFSRRIAGNRQLLAAVGVGLLLQLAAIYEPHLQSLFQTVPLGFGDWLLIVGLALAVLGVIEAAKGWFLPRLRLAGQRTHFSIS